ncbi:hypothetical protein [Actinophytocola algeriensis]|uniref:hypothetical protein n=1 Tax=Actinophytocola algeriensis TaxID=1768010 RepID=UPI001789BD14|nr:hypothetical protein [Actinophytocola algeriensis]MBE1472176.1 hypothetical protein [Actinophytocola algeriensis]
MIVMALAAASVVLGIAPATTSTAFALTASTVGVALAVATGASAVRAPHRTARWRSGSP